MSLPVPRGRSRQAETKKSSTSLQLKDPHRPRARPAATWHTCGCVRMPRPMPQAVTLDVPIELIKEHRHRLTMLT